MRCFEGRVYDDIERGTWAACERYLGTAQAVMVFQLYKEQAPRATLPRPANRG
jgi:hypothetical protein